MKIFFFLLLFILFLPMTSVFARTTLTESCPNIQVKSSAYTQSRSLYQLGLLHPAFRGFDSLLSNPRESVVAKQSAAECVRLIEVAHPHFKLSASAVQGLVQSPAHLQAHRTLLTLLMRGQLLPADYPKDLLTRVEDATAVKLVSAMQATQKNPTVASLPVLLSALTNANKLPEPALFKPLYDLANLTAARLLYMADRNKEALDKANEILKKYPSFSEAYELKSWIELALKKNQESIQDSITLRTPSLKNYFSPQTTILPAMVFLENCDYSTAKPHLSYFRAKYKSENDYLSQTNHDYYQDFISALKQKGTLSSKIVASWVASPVLMALFDENNLLIDEKTVTTHLHYTKIQSYLQDVQTGNLTKIRNQFSHLVYSLRTDLNDAVQNAALVQVDVLLGVSKEMAMTEPGREPSNQKNSPATNSVKQHAKWSWEKKDTSKMESDEIWSDEIGNLDVEINNKCK